MSVRPNDEDDDSYEFAEMGMILYNGDRIRISSKSGAILTFADLSILELKEDSVIVLDLGNEKFSKVSFVLGKIWVNVNRMIRDGNMDIEMNQVVAGIKGTIFVCEEDGKTSRLKVLEGTVSLTPNGKKGVIVSAGEQASVSNGELSRVTQFDLQDEIETWDPESQGRIIHALQERGIVLGAKDAQSRIEEPPVQAPVVESNKSQATYGWVLTERKPVRGITPAPEQGGEVQVEFGDDMIEMLLAKPYGNGAGGSRDLKNPQRLHARYSWSMPDVIKPGGQLVIVVKQKVLSSDTGKWNNAFGVGIGIENNWYLKGKTSDGTLVEPWVFGIGWGRPDWAQKDAVVTYERTWLWNEGKAGDKRTVSVSIQGVGTQKIEYLYKWKSGEKG